MCTGNIEENAIGLIQFRDALTFGCSSKASKRNIIMKIWVETEGNHTKIKREHVCPNESYDKSHAIITHIYMSKV